MVDFDSADWSGPERQRLALQQAADAKLAQRVMGTHREAFQIRFPGQCEHIMRLIAERLQTGLRKDNPVELSAAEICDLSQALNQMFAVHQQLQS